MITEQIPLYPKSVRDGMAYDKLKYLFEIALLKSYNNYDLLDKNINDPNKLKDTYNL